MYHIQGLADSPLQTGQFPQINLKFNAILIKISVRIFVHSISHVALRMRVKKQILCYVLVLFFFFFN